MISMQIFKKWFITMAGAISLCVGIVMKIIEKPANYEQFILGNSYILIVVGLEAIILNFAFNSIIDDND